MADSSADELLLPPTSLNPLLLLLLLLLLLVSVRLPTIAAAATLANEVTAAAGSD